MLLAEAADLYVRPVLEGAAAEEKDEFDHEDDDYRSLEEKGATLIELIDHVVIQLLGGLQLLRDEVLVIGHTDSGCGQAVETGGKHIAEELDGVVGTLGELHHIEQNRMQVGGRFCQPPAGENS